MTSRLADLLVRIEAGKSFGAAARPACDEEWGIVKVSAMTWGEFRPAENKVVTDTGRVDSRYEIRPGDVLVSRANTTEYVGAPVLVRNTRPRLLLSDKSLRLVPRAGVDPAYLHAIMSAPQTRQRISARATGIKDSMRNISQSALLQLEVPTLPPLAEQRRIVEFLEDHLSHLDAAERAVGDSLRRSRAMTRSSLAAVVTAGSVGSPTSTIGTEAEVVQYGTSAKCHEIPTGGDVPVLRMGNLKDGEIDLKGLKFLSGHHSDLPKLLLAAGDLLFNRTNSAELVGKSAIYESDATTSFASYLIRVRFKNTVEPHWANVVINSPQGRDYISSVASQQVGQANVNGTKLKAFPLPLPPPSRQRELVSRHRQVVEAARRLNESMQDSRRRSSALRRSLLAAAFSGRLTAVSTDVSVPEEMIGA